MLVFKTKNQNKKPSLATLNQGELVEQTLLTLAQVAPGVAFQVSTKFQNKSHTKAAQQYGGGGVYRHLFRSNVSTRINGDEVFPQIQIVDRTYSGASLRVYVGFYRLICSNGLTVAVGETMQWKIDHRLSSAEQLMQLTNSIAAAWSAITNAQQILTVAARISVNPFRVIESLPFSEPKKAKLKAALPAARPEDNVQTVYGLYNFLNEQDRIRARRNSTAHLDRDTQLLSQILELAAA